MPQRHRAQRRTAAASYRALHAAALPLLVAVLFMAPIGANCAGNNSPPQLTFQDFFSGLSPASFFEDTYQKQLMVHHNGNGDATPTLQRVTQPLADVDKLCAVYEEYNLPEGFLKVGGGR